MTNDTRYLILSIDTEADLFHGRIIPISKMVYGEVDGEKYGITKIMDLCERHHCKATFFVSPFETKVLGEEGMKAVCQEIADRGHDVQLHTHPKWITNERFMWNHSYEHQVELLTYGKELIHRWIGEYPIAHRAGGFGADHNTLKALAKVGIPVDSSHLGSPFCRLDVTQFQRNHVQDSREGIVELSVTQFAQFKVGGFMPLKPFDINANTLSELKFVIQAAKASHIKVLTLLMHSFSFLHRNSDRTVFTPNGGDLKKFEQLLDFVTHRGDCEIMTVKEFYNQYHVQPSLFACSSNGSVPVSGFLRSTTRAFRYMNRGKGNLVIVVSVCLGSVLLFGGIAILWWILRS